RRDEVARIDLEEASAAEETPRDEAIALEAGEALLYDRERRVQEPGQLPRIALPEQLEGDQEPRPGLGSKRRADRHMRSYDIFWRSKSRGPCGWGPGRGARIREAYPSLALEVRNQRDMESFD